MLEETPWEGIKCLGASCLTAAAFSVSSTYSAGNLFPAQENLHMGAAQHWIAVDSGRIGCIVAGREPCGVCSADAYSAHI